MEFTADNLEKAVTLFYRTEAHQQAEAHQWLTEAQNSPLAWSFVWELLNPQRSSEVQFFAATTLHTKLMKHWNEIPEDHYELLKKRILDSIISYASGPKIILNRLCITLSAYIIHTVPNHWPKAFEELVSSFQPQYLPNVEPERVIWILLEILTVIPEEFQRTTLALNQRNRVRQVLQDVSKDILTVVEMCLMPIPAAGFNMGNLTTYLNASRCASAWIQLGGLNMDECNSVNNLLIDLTCYVYWNKSDPEGLSGDEMDLMEITVEALTAIFQHPNTHKYKNHVFKYAAQILHKFDKILDVERNQQDMNKDVVATLYGLVIAIGDTHSRVFIDNLKSQDPEAQRVCFDLLNFILKCSNLPGFYPIDESSSTLTFGFWYTLQDDIISLEAPECASLILTVKPYYRDLVCVMLRKSMFPVVDDNNWSLDDKEVFRCYRQDIADTFMYCYVVLNLEMLDILMTKLTEALRTNNSSVPVQWNEVETVLHAFGAVAESIEYENLYLPKLMTTIKNIPFNELHIKVMATALETVGAFSEWFMDHPDLLENIFPLVLTGLGNPEVSTSATMALKDITQNCQKYLAPFGEHILIASQTVLQSGNLKPAECRRLMYSIGRVLSTLPVDRIMTYLNMILAPSFEDLQKYSEADPTPAISNSLVIRLRLIAALFSSLSIESGEKKVEQPILVVMQKMMPIFRIIGEKYCRNAEVIEDLSVVFKCGVSTLKDDCKPLINDILQLIVTIYREYPQSTILNVAKTVLILFGREDEFCRLNQQLLYELANTTMQMCAQYNTTNQLSEKSDVLEGFFGMLAALAKKVPQLLTTCGVDIAALFQCAILCLVLPEIQAVKQVSSFLVQFISLSRETSLAQVIQAYGESLVLRILMNLGSTAPRTSVDIFSDILLALNKKYCDNLSRWLNSLLAQDGFPSPRITASQKEAFVKSILREKTSKRRVCDTVLEFTLICRGILKPE
ncbi:importin-13 [Diabrotica virgifera virgifera]|uniref:Importin-13 n=4 Tax=Diabrotica virgifera virgifera TaxID=50390 RepID=A0ABM5KBY7_DIAVI|nr:importin-13 [Diabrotica virgifera virgifera]